MALYFAIFTPIILGLIIGYFLLKFSSEKDDGNSSFYHWKDDVRNDLN
jgi:hypothetical protein